MLFEYIVVRYVTVNPVYVRIMDMIMEISVSLSSQTALEISLFLRETEFCVPVVELRRGVTGDGVGFLDAGHFLLVESSAFTAHEAVLISLDMFIREKCRVADVENSTVVLLIGIVAIRLVNTGKASAYVTKKTSSSRWKVQRLEHTTDFLLILNGE